MVRVGVLTVSDRISRGEGEDRSGDAIVSWCADRGYPLVRRGLVPDGTSSIVPHLLNWSDSGEIDLLLTTGGTGFSPRDLTPEATRAVVERPATGLAEAIRRAGAEAVPTAVLSRGVVGIRANCLIVNLPGSTGGVRDGLALLGPLLEHVRSLLSGDDPHSSSDPERLGASSRSEEDRKDSMR